MAYKTQRIRFSHTLLRGEGDEIAIDATIRIDSYDDVEIEEILYVNTDGTKFEGEIGPDDAREIEDRIVGGSY